ncbi:Isoleucine--tRNA ligase [Methyloligella halotolerans]|uniref:Isoleucine--tRNA ligase n=1 Tax=Methyloligella halotolerans TaxID=1177755 RepID=A0A1E2RYA9_9HYPH|nr:Isoleucine--tRNA ligase [Methyloligella halotolerans]
MKIQSEEFQRLGMLGDWDNPYTTMAFEAEATIAAELMKFALNGTLYRGSKPVMWSVVEKTALAEAEVEYQEVVSDTIFVKFPLTGASSGNLDPHELLGASIVIWTTTPWTIPGNRAIAYSPNIEYGLYEVTAAPDDNWAKVGDRLIVADSLSENLKTAARIEEWQRLNSVSPDTLKYSHAAHPLSGRGYDFRVPLLPGDHVTAETGTGFVHTAPGHGMEDFELWEDKKRLLEERGIDTAIPFTVDAGGFFTDQAKGFTGKRVLNDKGEKGDANETVIAALKDADALVARGKLRHDYPHSWRSKKPVIFRNTPQWFIAMDEPIEGSVDSLRDRALRSIRETRFVPASGENRLRGMVESKPDWVVSRQRAWGVPITVFRHPERGEIAPGPKFGHSEELVARITEAFRTEGADAWFADGAKERFLSGLVDDPAQWEKVDDILDVWFDSGCTHAFVLEQREDLQWPASLYLEGSDQHRGWFQSSLLESCGTRGRAPYDAVLTHGFTMDEQGRKMSKSAGNTTAPQDVIKQSGAEILRLWAMSSDYWEDLRIGPEILKANVDAYRKLRNAVRFMLGNLAHYRQDLRVFPGDMPELERYMLHRLAELDVQVRANYNAFDFKRVFQMLFNFCVNDLSAFYFDLRKDALYCEPYDSPTRRAALTVLDQLFTTLTAWLAPMLCFTMEEAWLNRFPSDKGSVHLRHFPDIPEEWLDEELDRKWRKVRQIRRVVTGALEIERRERRIGASLDAAPKVYIAYQELRAALSGLDPAEIFITSAPASSWARDRRMPSVWTRWRAWPSRSSWLRDANAPAPGRSPKMSAAIRISPISAHVTPRRPPVRKAQGCGSGGIGDEDGDGAGRGRARRSGAGHSVGEFQARYDRGPRLPDPRSGKQAVADLLIRHRREGAGDPCPVLRPRHGLEPRHQLWPAAAGLRFRPLGAHRVRPRRLHRAGPMAVPPGDAARRHLRRPHHRRRHRQRHRPHRLWGGGRFLLHADLRLRLVRVQSGRLLGGCRGRRPSL